MKVGNWIRKKIKSLMDLKDAPHAIAIGVSVGIFFGFTPLWGLKTLLTLGVTRLLRGSLVAAVIGVTLHDLILPVMPFLLRWQYQVGYWLLSHPHQWPPGLHLHLRQHAQTGDSWLHWSTFFNTGLPILVGSVIFSAPISVIAYYATVALVKRARIKEVPKEV